MMMSTDGDPTCRVGHRRRRDRGNDHQRQIKTRSFLVFSLVSALLRNADGAVAPATFGVAAAPTVCFAGFGSNKAAAGGGATKKKKKAAAKKKGGGARKNKRGPGTGGPARSTSNAPAAAAAAAVNLLTPEGRIEHIRSRVEAADLKSMAELTLTKNADDQLALDVNPNAVYAVDNFLGPEMIRSMRAEAEGLLGTMVPSQSTRWDEATQSVVPYDKVGVLSMQIEGGEKGYAASPRLVEYVATLTGELSRSLNAILPDTHRLSGVAQTNKLAVCLGDGSKYDKHIDNLGGGTDDGGDRRKLTALLYLQPSDSHPASPSYPDESEVGDEKGGYFRAYDVPDFGDVTSIAPRGDRLLMFWSDALVHDVSPSFAPTGDDDRRWALTVWLLADEETGMIRATDAAIEERHFGSG